MSLPELVAIGGQRINAGNNQREEEDNASVFADRQEQQEDSGPGPAQEAEPFDLEEDLQDAIEEIAAGLDFNQDGMKIIAQCAEHLPINGAPVDMPTAIHAVLALLKRGMQQSTITSRT